MDPLLNKLFARWRSEGDTILPIHLVSSVNSLSSKWVTTDVPSRWARISEVFGRFAGFLSQHRFVSAQTVEVNPTALGEAGFGGLSPLITKSITMISVLLGNGIFPLYN